MTTPLPKDAVLLHIGPHKTGTSAIQGALAAARDVLPDHGAIYPGRQYSHNTESRWPLDRDPRNGREKPTADRWNSICSSVRDSPDHRFVVSSEVFDFATPEQVQRVVEDLGRRRVHVVVTLRPLASMLPSIWQQRIKGRNTERYVDWLRRMLDTQERSSAFWHQHRHDALITRWMTVVGRERITVVIVDPRNPDNLFRSFEELLNLPTGLLEAQSDSRNRSLTAVEVELLRRINVELDRIDLSPQRFGQLMRQGVVKQLKDHRLPDSSEARIRTPQWALDAVHAISQDMLSNIQALGVNVMGDLNGIAATKKMDESAVIPEDLGEVPIDVAVHATVGVVRSGSRKLRKSAAAAQ